MMTEKRTVSEAMKLAKDSNVQIVDLKFTDLLGTLQHFSIPVGGLDARNPSRI